MGTISEGDVWVVALPLNKSFSTSNKITTAARLVMVTLRTADGVQGWGEAPLNPTFTAESPTATRELLREVIERELVGVDPLRVSAAALARSLGGSIAAACALSMALWDLRGRALGAPVYELLGGARRTAVPTVSHVGNFDVAQDVADAEVAVAAGFPTIKLKVGRQDVAADIDAVERIREAVGRDLRIHVDVNQAWNRAQAGAFAQHARTMGVAVIEQPIPQWDLAGMAELSATPGVIVAADESIFDARGLLTAVTADVAPAAAVVKLLKAAGIDGVVDSLRLCALTGVQPFLAGMPGDTSLGSAALLHLAAATDALPLGTAITPHFSAVDIIAEPLKVHEGNLYLADVDGPGFGVVVDRDAVTALEAVG